MTTKTKRPRGRKEVPTTFTYEVVEQSIGPGYHPTGLLQALNRFHTGFESVNVLKNGRYVPRAAIPKSKVSALERVTWTALSRSRVALLVTVDLRTGNTLKISVKPQGAS